MLHEICHPFITAVVDNFALSRHHLLASISLRIASKLFPFVSGSAAHTNTNVATIAPTNIDSAPSTPHAASISGNAFITTVSSVYSNSMLAVRPAVRTAAGITSDTTTKTSGWQPQFEQNVMPANATSGSQAHVTGDIAKPVRKRCTCPANTDRHVADPRAEAASSTCARRSSQAGVDQIEIRAKNTHAVHAI